MPIALLTDFGTSDYYVGAMKGVIQAVNRKARFIDITHDIEPQNISSAAFVLRACYRDFPDGTIFLAVIDPGVGSERRAIIVEHEHKFFVGPDNGLFSFVLINDPPVWAIENEQYFRRVVSQTFHGRDIFAPVAAHLSLGLPPREFGRQINDPVFLADITPKKTAENMLEGRIIHVDRFGNLVTNITADQAAKAFELHVGENVITDRREFYAGAESAKPFAIIGSAGFLEISINKSSAAEQLGARTDTRIVLRYI